MSLATSCVRTTRFARPVVPTRTTAPPHSLPQSQPLELRFPPKPPKKLKQFSSGSSMVITAFRFSSVPRSFPMYVDQVMTILASKSVSCSEISAVVAMASRMEAAMKD
ncbi:glycosyltransferase family 1 protein [Sesbania bispinosa]|nr:glycosyltransferase family 1 protein [Sesbania bispinosa]